MGKDYDAQDDDLLRSSLVDTGKQPSARNRQRAGSIGGNKMDQTCIDTDDDDLEFDNAQKEELEDQTQHELEAFMVSNQNISRYHEMTQQILETDAHEEESYDEKAN